MSFTALLTGAGSIARRHARNLRELRPGVRLVAVCRGDDAIRWAREERVDAVPSLEQGLAQRPQLAVVCSASHRHAEELDALLPAVEALYVEKPVITQQAALDRLADSVARFPRPSVVGCNLRYLGAVRRLQQLIESGAAGRVVLATLQVGQWLPDWRPGRDWRTGYSADRAQGGGVLFDLVHELDGACHLFGPIAHAQAAAGRRSGLGIAADDVAAMTLLMRSGLPVQVCMDYVRQRPVREYLVVGDAASLRLDIPGKRLARDARDGVEELPMQPADWDMAGTYVAAMQDLLESWESGHPSYYSLGDALHVTGWMLRLEREAWRGAEQPTA